MPKVHPILPRSKNIREKVFSCHTFGCLATGGEVNDDGDFGGGGDEDGHDEDLAKSCKME